MKILITGRTGFIGKAIYQHLEESGFELLNYRCKIDFMNPPMHQELVEMFKKVDVVINAVGIIAETKTQTFEQMHTLAPIALFDACKEAGVKKVIHISALGTQTGTTDYHVTKNRADEYLRACSLDYAILHPSVVYGDDGKSTAFFQALATLPVTPIIGDGSQLLQPIRIEDLVTTVQKCIESDNKTIELNVVGAEPVTYKELLEIFRAWLRLLPEKSVSTPTIGTNVLGKILGEPTVNQDNITMLNEGNSASVKPLADFLGYTPIGMKENLGRKEANNAQKLYASLYLLRPLLRLIIGFVWIWSGIVSAFLYPQPLALELLHDVGIPVGVDVPLLYVASFLDIAIGILTIIGFRLQLLLNFQLLVIVVYTLLLTALAPYHWLHPFGPVLKNLPLVLAIYVLGRLEKYR